MHAAAAFSAAMIAGLALSGCPMQPSYSSTITPVYAATGTGLSVFNGTGWTSYPFANASAVVVSGSGAGAVAYVGNNTGGVSQFIGTSRIATTGLAGSDIKRLFSGSSIFAATNAGVSILNSDGLTWTNYITAASVNDVFSSGTYTLVASGTGLYEYNNGIPVGSTISPADDSAAQHDGDGSLCRLLWRPHCRDRQRARGPICRNVGLGKPAFASAEHPVNQITADQSGNLYAATKGGLYIISTSVLPPFPGARVLRLRGRGGHNLCGQGPPRASRCPRMEDQPGRRSFQDSR